MPQSPKDHDGATGKWNRREKKRRPKMAIHGRGMKQLAKKLDHDAKERSGTSR